MHYNLFTYCSFKHQHKHWLFIFLCASVMGTWCVLSLKYLMEGTLMLTFFPDLETPHCCPAAQCILRPGLNDETASSCCFSTAWPRGCHIQWEGRQIRAEHLGQWGQQYVLLSLQPESHTALPAHARASITSNQIFIHHMPLGHGGPLGRSWVGCPS